MKTTNAGTSNGDHSINGILSKLNQTCEDIGSNEARGWLIDQLCRRKITTRDIYHFALKQAQLRTEDQSLDTQTVKHAMRAKRRDINSILSKLKRTMKIQEEDLLTELNGRKYK